jgi:hypothetical protein
MGIIPGFFIQGVVMKKIYIMQCGNYIKIGVSDNPERRIKDLQTGNPFEIKLLLSVKNDDAYYTEKFFFQILMLLKYL